ncbi:hypothetical protein BDZ89DRAFT_1082312 [Hymenopellis radicata]|nr:hypothetical protein BDZ89DRAFT_1082312 [Hymenopellis radicata]
MSLYSRPSFLQPAICTSSLPALMTFSLATLSTLACFLPCILTCAIMLWIVRVVKAVSTSFPFIAQIIRRTIARPIAHSLPRRPFPLSAPTLARFRRPSSSEKTLIPSTKEVPPDEALLRFGERRCMQTDSCGYRRCVDPSYEEREQSPGG